ncbi:MAG: enoyl-CoA hydratase [Deltaproteobacteria bacterium]|nr:enoyl-CoA hydratase [Candidatus Zymogenaceae bacterium]
MSENHVLYEKKDGIAVITLNRPEVRNALNLAMLYEIERLFKEADADDDVRVIVFTGAGDRAFSAGLDLSDLRSFMAAEEDPDNTELFAGERGFRTIREMKKPVIAAVNGYAVTGGLELVLGCDIIIAADTAKFGDTHAKVGVTPGAGMSQILPRIVGSYKAKLMSLTGEFMDVQAAYTAGLVARVVEGKALMDEAMRLAGIIASFNDEQVRRIKRMIDRGGDLSLADGMALEAREFVEWKETKRG